MSEIRLFSGNSELCELCELREQIINAFGKNEYNVGIRINTEENHLSAIYRGHRVCRIRDQYNYDQTYRVVFEGDFSEFYHPRLPRLARCSNIESIVHNIEHRITQYNKKKGQKNMMTARGNGKTKYVSDLLKDAFRFNPIKDVIFNDPATIVFWTDGTKTVVKCQPGETFDPEKGLAMAISKKVLGNDYGYYETFAKYVGRYNKKHKEK